MHSNRHKTLSLRKNEIDVFSDFQENTVISIEILRHSVFPCLYSTEDDDTFQQFVSQLGTDQVATIHFKKSMVYDKFVSFCTSQRVLLIPTSSKDQINTVLSKIQNCEIYCIEDKDRDKLSKYENSKLLNNYASPEKLENLRLTLHSHLNERFEVFNAVQSVMVCYRTTYMTFFYLTEEVISSYYDLTPQTLDFPSDSESSAQNVKNEEPTIIPFYYEEKANQKNSEEENALPKENFQSPPHQQAYSQPHKSPVFVRDVNISQEKEDNNKDNNKTLSLRKNEIDVFSDFKENIIQKIEVLRHSIYTCLYSTEDNDTFKQFISQLGNDKIVVIHFKKSMIYDKFFSLCTSQCVLLVPTSSKDQINTVLSKIQNCEIYCIEDKDRDKLSKYENSKLLNNYASPEKLENLRLTLHSHLNERFEVFNAVQSVMVCYRTTYMTFFYLTEEVISSYYDLTPQPLDFPSDSESSTQIGKGEQPTIIPFYYDEKQDKNHIERSSLNSNSNLNLNSKSSSNMSLHKVPSLQKNEIDIFRDFQENVIEEIEILPHATFRCLYSTENSDTFHQFVSEIADDPITTVHYKKSMIYEKYFSFCTDHHALLIPYELTDQINEVLSKIQNSEIFCVSEKDRDKLQNFENCKLIKSFASSQNLEHLRETLHARLNERFEVFNVAQSVMICYRTTYMTFFYLTEEVLSTYYDLKTKPHKYLFTSSNSNLNLAPIKSEDASRFGQLAESLDSRIQVLHSKISGNEKYMGTNSTLIDVDDLLQVMLNHKTKKGLSDCVKTYENVNQGLKEAEESVTNYLEKNASLPSALPSLNRSKSNNPTSSEDSSVKSEAVENEEIEDQELKKLKYDVESLQNQINQIEQQIKYSNSNEQSFTKVNSPRRLSPREPTILPSSPRRTATTISPRTARNRLRSMQKRVDAGDITAMYSLGACYALGDGVPEDKEKALHYYMLAAEKGNKNAQYAAAACHSYGKGTQIDKNKAFELYLRAAEQGHPKAQFAVGHFYEYGQGGAERDHEIAKKWYRLAAEQGHLGAKQFIDQCPSETPLQNDY